MKLPALVLDVEPNADPILICILCGRETTMPPELRTTYLTPGGSATAGLHRRCYDRAAQHALGQADVYPDW